MPSLNGLLESKRFESCVKRADMMNHEISLENNSIMELTELWKRQYGNISKSLRSRNSSEKGVKEIENWFLLGI